MRLLVSGTTLTLYRILERNRHQLGRLTSPDSGFSPDSLVASGLPFAADNGAFTGFDAAKFRRMVTGLRGKPGLLWVVAPDVVGDARATLAMFDEWEPWLREQGVPVAYVGQDGQEEFEPPWERFEAWFIGGSTKWKLSQASADLASEAKNRGKWVHMGRVNSLRRLRAAWDIGCDSVDGTGMSRWGDKHLEKFCRWLRSLNSQRTLWNQR